MSLLPVAVIVEATYGVSLHEDRPVREARLTTRVREILSRGGRVLMPVVALGRAQARFPYRPVCRHVHAIACCSAKRSEAATA